MLKRLEDPNIAGIVLSDISRLFRPEFAHNLVISKPFVENGKLIFYEDGVLDLNKDRDTAIFISLAMEAGAARKRIIKNTQWGRNRRRKDGDCKTDPLPAGVKFIPHPKTDPNDLVTGHFEYTHDLYSDRVVEAFRRIAAGTLRPAHGFLLRQDRQQRNDDFAKHPGAVNVLFGEALPLDAIVGQLPKVLERVRGPFPAEAVKSPKQYQIEPFLIGVLE